jgi:hypothetical protein
METQEKLTMRERDKRIYTLNVVDRIPQRTLATIYGISRGRVNQIIVAEKNKRRDEKDICLRDRIIKEFEYLDDKYMDSTGRRASANVRVSIITVFRYLKKWYKEADLHEFYNLFLNMKYDELIEIRSMGIKKAAIIKEIQDLIKQNGNYYRYHFLNNCTKITTRDDLLF